MVLTFILTILYSEENPCRISKNNVAKILQHGVDKNVFSSNCLRLSDTLTFSVDKNDSDIEDGEMFFLKKGKIAIYKKDQHSNSFLVFNQPILDKEAYELSFQSICGGYHKNGSMKITCIGDTLNILDFKYYTSIE